MNGRYRNVEASNLFQNLQSYVDFMGSLCIEIVNFYNFCLLLDNSNSIQALGEEKLIDPSDSMHSTFPSQNRLARARILPAISRTLNLSQASLLAGEF